MLILRQMALITLLVRVVDIVHEAVVQSSRCQSDLGRDTLADEPRDWCQYF